MNNHKWDDGLSRFVVDPTQYLGETVEIVYKTPTGHSKQVRGELTEVGEKSVTIMDVFLGKIEVPLSYTNGSQAKVGAERITSTPPGAPEDWRTIYV